MFVRCNPTSYTTTETKGNVTVWIHVEERVKEPFTVALIPGKGDVISLMYSYILQNYNETNCAVLHAGFEKSTNHYKLECNVRLEFNSSVQSLSHTYDITDDVTCDFQFGRGRQEGVNLFKVDLVLVNSTNPLVGIDFNNAEATVFIDDSMEEECSELLLRYIYIYIYI